MHEAAPISIPSTSLAATEAPAPSAGAGTGSVVLRRSWFRRSVFPLLIVLFVFAIFMEALAAGYVYWDDDDLLLLNTAYRSLSWERLEWMFTTSYTGHFQPLTWLSYWLDFTLWRGDVFGFHLTNVVLHAFTAVTVYCVAGRLLRLVCKDRADSVISINSAAALTAVLFACHPLRVESVAWIAERRDVLGGFFFMVSITFYLRFVDATSRTARDSMDREEGLSLAQGAGDALVETNPRRSKVYYFAALAACLLSLLSKATAMTLPVVLLILDVYPLGRLGRHAGFVRVPSHRVWLEKVPFFALAAFGAARALVAQAEVGALKSVGTYDWISRFVQACYGLAFYAWKTVWPVSLGPLYQIPSREVLLGDKLWFLVFGVCGVIAAVIALRRRWPGLLAVLAVYVVVLSPVLGFAQSGPQLVADRYSYLSCIGFAILGGYGLLRLARAGWFKRSPHARAAVGLLAAAPVGVLAHLTYAQAYIWSGPIALWQEGVRISPTSSVAHVNYADALFQAGDLGSAYDQYDIALELDPHDVVGLHHRGDLYIALGLPHLAIRDYIRALRIDPARRRAPLSLARLLVAGGHAREAAVVLRDSAGRNPDSFVLMRFLADLLATHPDARVRDGVEAVRWASKVVLAEGQSHIPSQVTLATALAEAGRFSEAVATAEAALSSAQRKDDRLFVETLRHRLELFRQRQPFRMPSALWPFEQDDGPHDAHSK